LRKRCSLEGVVDGENSGDDSVDPTCVGGEVKDQDVDEAHGKKKITY